MRGSFGQAAKVILNGAHSGEQLRFDKSSYAIDMPSPKATLKSREAIIQAFTEHWLEEGEAPASVFAFCKSLKMKERDFYSEFASFDAVESAFWEAQIEQVRRAVEAGKEWATFSAQQRLLAFLYAYFEHALDHRSLALLRIKPLRLIEHPQLLHGFEASYRAFIAEIIKHAHEQREIADRGRLNTFYPEAFLFHFRFLIEENLKDTSPGFERTDALIEKTVKLAFDLLKAQALESAVDLARWFIQLPRESAASHHKKSSCRA